MQMDSEQEELGNKCCETCAWYAEFEGVCCNGDSEYRADFRCLDDLCSCWTSKEDLNNGFGKQKT